MIGAHRYLRNLRARQKLERNRILIRASDGRTGLQESYHLKLYRDCTGYINAISHASNYDLAVRRRAYELSSLIKIAFGIYDVSETNGKVMSFPVSSLTQWI